MSRQPIRLRRSHPRWRMTCSTDRNRLPTDGFGSRVTGWLRTATTLGVHGIAVDPSRSVDRVLSCAVPRGVSALRHLPPGRARRPRYHHGLRFPAHRGRAHGVHRLGAGGRLRPGVKDLRLVTWLKIGRDYWLTGGVSDWSSSCRAVHQGPGAHAVRELISRVRRLGGKIRVHQARIRGRQRSSVAPAAPFQVAGER
jgi:hypothetical protein